MYGRHHTKVARKKISRKQKKSWKTRFERYGTSGLSKSEQKRYRDKRFRRKHRLAIRRFWKSKESLKTRRHLSRIFKGKKMPEKTKAKISETLKGRKISKRHRHNLSLAFKNRSKKYKTMIGKRHGRTRKLHDQAVQSEARYLRRHGYKVFASDHFRPDLIVRRGKRIYGIEIQFGRPNLEKYKDQEVFDDIWWIQKQHRRRKR